MTAIYHDPIVVGESNNPSTVNTRLSDLDSAIVDLDDRVDDLVVGAGTSPAEVVDARNAGNTGGAVAVLRDRIDYAAARAYHPKAYGAVGDGVTNDYAALNTLWNTTMSAGGYCIIDRSYVIGSNISVPTGTILVFQKGGMLVPSTGVTVTIGSVPVAGLYQIFSGAGVIKWSGAGTPPMVYPQWWGARKPSGSTGAENSAAVNKAIQSLETGHSWRTGGTVYFIQGLWTMDGTILVNVDSVTLQGAGMQNTELNFATQASGNAITFSGSAWAKMRDMAVYDAATVGVSIEAYVSNFEMENVRVSESRGKGIYIGGGFMGTYRQVYSSNNAGIGFDIEGYATSLTFISCFASGNASSGWDIALTTGPSGNAGLTYSTFIGCGADGNTSHGYRIRAKDPDYPVNGLAFIGCGAEGAGPNGGNDGAGWYLDATTAGSTLRGISLVACFAVNNNESNSWSNFLYAKDDSAGNSVIEAVTLLNCRGYAPGAGTYNVVADGAKISIIVDACSFSSPPVSLNGAVIQTRGAGILSTPRLPAGSVTIAAGAISTGRLTNIMVDTEGGAATDDLDTINGGQEGDIVIIHTASSSRDVTIKHNTGNIDCGSDKVLDSNRDMWMGIYGVANRWQQVGFNSNG